MTDEELFMPVARPTIDDEDPLAKRPRVSSIVLCAVLGVVLLVAAAGVWWLAVRTEYGQAFDDMVWQAFQDSMPSWLTLNALRFGGFELLGASSNLIVAGSALLVIIAYVVAAVRRRWWLLGQLTALIALSLATDLLKDVLPRPFIINVSSMHGNSSPSGHTLLAFVAGVALLLAVSRPWRAVAAIVAACWGTLVAMSVVAGRWHRPSDAAVSLLIVGGVALIVLAVTRGRGMDDPGKRVSSASVQIIASVMITGGLAAVAYATYVIWQVMPGMSTSAEWAQAGAVGGSAVMLGGLAVLVSGLVLAMRQLTVAPLTRHGLVGAPPAPPTPSAPAAPPVPSVAPAPSGEAVSRL